jgi:hypothetical protein
MLEEKIGGTERIEGRTSFGDVASLEVLIDLEVDGGRDVVSFMALEN